PLISSASGNGNQAEADVPAKGTPAAAPLAPSFFGQHERQYNQSHVDHGQHGQNEIADAEHALVFRLAVQRLLSPGNVVLLAEQPPKDASAKGLVGIGAAGTGNVATGE